MKKISPHVHTLIGVAGGLLLVIAPWIFRFDDETAPATVAIAVGIWIVLNELVTKSRPSLIQIVPMKIHIGMDIVTGLFLAVSPWLFGFYDHDAASWIPHLVVGLLVVGYAAITDPTDDPGRGPSSPIDTPMPNPGPGDELNH